MSDGQMMESWLTGPHHERDLLHMVPVLCILTLVAIMGQVIRAVKYNRAANEWNAIRKYFQSFVLADVKINVTT